jgi:hypothetical protein
MKYKAYICSTDALYHVPDDFGGIQIFFTEESLRANKSCVDSGDGAGCRVCEIEIEVPDDT